MNPKEQMFVYEYIINKGNVYQAALRAGYAKNTAEHAREWLEETAVNCGKKKTLPYKPYLQEAIDERLKEISDSKKANAAEVLEYLTSVMRKTTTSSVLVIESVGDGKTKARIVEKPPDEKEALKAAEMLAKILGMTKKKAEITINDKAKSEMAELLQQRKEREANASK